MAAPRAVIGVGRVLGLRHHRQGVIVAALTAKVPSTAVYLIPSVLIAASCLAVAAAGNGVTAVLAYAAAGFACSAMLPLSLAGQEFARLGATSAGELIAGYQVGYGITAFGVAPLEQIIEISLAGSYIVGAGVAVRLAMIARIVAVRKSHHPTTASRTDLATQGANPVIATASSASGQPA